MIEIKYEDLFTKRQEEEKKPEETGKQETTEQREGSTPERLCLHFSDEFMDSIKKQGKPVE